MTKCLVHWYSVHFVDVFSCFTNFHSGKVKALIRNWAALRVLMILEVRKGHATLQMIVFWFEELLFYSYGGFCYQFLYLRNVNALVNLYCSRNCLFICE
jgi:hypothetical protein